MISTVDATVLVIVEGAGDRRWEVVMGGKEATHLRGLLGSPGLTLGERRRGGFLALLGRLSLRKGDHQRIAFTK